MTEDTTEAATGVGAPPDPAAINVAMAATVGGVVAYHHVDEDGPWMTGDGEPGDIHDHDDHIRQIDRLAAFVRANPGVPPEALYRFAHGQGVHTMPVDDWAKRPFWVRLSYRLFATVLMHADEALKEEDANAAAQLQADQAAKGPIPASALSADVRDTIMELQPDPLELNKGMTLVKVDDAAKTPAPADAVAQADPAPETAVGQNVDGVAEKTEGVADGVGAEHDGGDSGSAPVAGDAGVQPADAGSGEVHQVELGTTGELPPEGAAVAEKPAPAAPAKAASVKAEKPADPPATEAPAA